MKAIAAARPAVSVDRVLVARALWLCATASVAVLFAIGTPLAFTQFHHACALPHCSDWQLTAAGMRQLHSAGLSLDAYAASIVGIDLMSALIWAAVSASTSYTASPRPTPASAAARDVLAAGPSMATARAISTALDDSLASRSRTA